MIIIMITIIITIIKSHLEVCPQLKALRGLCLEKFWRKLTDKWTGKAEIGTLEALAAGKACDARYILTAR